MADAPVPLSEHRVSNHAGLRVRGPTYMSSPVTGGWAASIVP